MFLCILTYVFQLGKCRRKNLVGEKLPKTVYCELHVCIHTGTMQY